MQKQVVKIMLVDDQEDDYIIFRDIVRRIEPFSVDLHWTETMEEAIRLLESNRYDICFIDYRLRVYTGIDLLREIIRDGIAACPVVILTGQGDYQIDMQAMQEGAADYLEKANLTPLLLERSIRYAIERTKSLYALQRSEQRMRILAAKLIHTQEQEIKETARELHDDVGSSLTAIKFCLERCIQDAGSTCIKCGNLNHAVRMVKHTIDNLRNIYSDLRPPMLGDLGIISTIRWYCRKFSKRYPEYHLELEMPLTEADIPETLKIILFRVLQESLQNIVQHSQADHVFVRLEKVNNRIDLTISDNGMGFDVRRSMEIDSEKSGIGLDGMRERTEYIGGRFEVISQAQKGTTVHASWDQSMTTALSLRENSQ